MRGLAPTPLAPFLPPMIISCIPKGQSSEVHIEINHNVKLLTDNCLIIQIYASIQIQYCSI